MPLPMPRLDSRTFDQLVDEGRSLLPCLAPDWTDHNYHDPGVTLIDLLAWLVEMDLYRLDRTSQATFRAFLRLIGIEPRPAQVAETVLVFSPEQAGGPLDLPQGVQVADQTGRIKFQTARNLLLSPARLASVFAGAETLPVDCSAQNQPRGKCFAVFGRDPQWGHALYLGSDRPLAEAGRKVSLYIWATAPEADQHVRQRLIEECRVEQTARKGCRPDMTRRRPDWRQHYSARTQWEYYAEPGQWLPLARVIDETRGLTLNGAVRFVVPDDSHPAKGGVKTQPNQYFIRCRWISGHYECPPEIQYIALNAVPARHAVEVEAEERAHEGDGRAGQVFHLSHAPVVPGSTRLRVQVNGGDDIVWREEATWDRVGPHDRAYVLSPETGDIVFGDGRYGRVLPSGAKVFAAYQSGGGLAGNVPANTLCVSLDPATVKVEQPFAATGGAKAEALDDAKGRAIAWLSEPHRAITLDDFERLARSTPGVPIARAHALADYDPALPCLPAQGSITVVVVPSCANPIPESGPDMLRAVERYLDRRRTLTTEVHVVAPSFVTVAVQARLHAGQATDPKALAAQARSTLDAFFDPLHGGSDRQGWPIGRDVYRAEVMALLNALPGVEHVDQASLLVEAELEVYSGNVAFKRSLHLADADIPLRARLRIEPHAVANQLVEQACRDLEAYIRSQGGGWKYKPPAAQRSEAAMVLNAIPSVLSVETIALEERHGPSGLCENVAVCAHSLIVSGAHRITVETPQGGRFQRPPELSCDEPASKD